MAHYVFRIARSATFIALFAAAALLGTLSGVLFAFAGDLPEISALDNYNPSTITRVYAANGEVIGEFAKEHEKPTVKAGWVDGKAVAPAYVKRLGEIPPREVLLGQFAGALNGVLYQVVGALEALREQRKASSAA